MTEGENIKYSKHKEIKGIGYQHYDNYDAIEVNYFDAIPSDYQGIMGGQLLILTSIAQSNLRFCGRLVVIQEHLLLRKS